MKTISELLEMAQDAQKQAQERKRKPDDTTDAQELERLQAQADAQNAREERPSDGLPLCPICKSKRVIYVVNNGAIAIKPCECRINAVNATAAGMMRQSLDKCAWDNFKSRAEWQERLKRMVWRWAHNTEPKMLVISGQSGCGKTHISACAARDRLKTCELTGKAEWFYWSRDIRDLKSQQVNDYPAFSSRIEQLKVCNMLVIDGLFDARQTDADITLIDELLYFRALTNNAGTIITTRLNLRQLASQAPSVFARMQAAARGFMFNLKREPGRNYYACACVEF